MTQQVQGKISAAAKSGKGFKLAGQDNWYNSDTPLLDLKFGDTVVLNLNTDGRIASFEKQANGKAAPAKFNSSPKANNYTRPMDNPDTQSRIARSHAVTTAVAILGPKKLLKEYIELADTIKSYTETGQLSEAPTPASKNKAINELTNLLEREVI